MLLKAARQDYEERSQNRGGTRTRKQNGIANPRLLSTANKQLLKSETKNTETGAQLQLQKQKIQLFNNPGQPPLSRPARKTMPSGKDTELLIDFKQSVTSKAASFVNKNGKIGSIIGLNQVVSELQEQLTQSLNQQQEHVSIKLSSLKITKREHEMCSQNGSNYQTAKDGSMTPIPTHRQGSMFEKREKLLSHQLSTSQFDGDKFQQQQLVFHTPSSNK